MYCGQKLGEDFAKFLLPSQNIWTLKVKLYKVKLQKVQKNNKLSDSVKFIYSEKATKILRNLHLTFDHSTHSQKLDEDFTKFCGILRIYEL